jgi:hypothetical protein
MDCAIVLVAPTYARYDVVIPAYGCFFPSHLETIADANNDTQDEA